MTTVIQAIKTYLQTYSELSDGPLWVNHLGEKSPSYSIAPLPGARISAHHIDNSTEQEFPFSLSSVESTADELQRLESVGFFELLADWFKDQTELDILPTMDSGKVPERIEALGWAYLFEQGESNTGIYQIQCRLTYSEEARV